IGGVGGLRTHNRKLNPITEVKILQNRPVPKYRESHDTIRAPQGLQSSVGLESCPIPPDEHNVFYVLAPFRVPGGAVVGIVPAQLASSARARPPKIQDSTSLLLSVFQGSPFLNRPSFVTGIYPFHS